MEIPKGPYPPCQRCREGTLVPIEIKESPDIPKKERKTSIKWCCTSCGHSRR